MVWCSYDLAQLWFGVVLIWCSYDLVQLWFGTVMVWCSFNLVQLWLGTTQATSHYLNQLWLDHRRIYTSLGLSELKGEYSAWSESRFTCYSHCYVTWCPLSHWGWVHICVGNLTIIGSDNGLSPGQRQAIIWINAGILLFGLLGTNFSEILIVIHKFSLTKMHLKMSVKWLPFCLGLDVLMMVIINSYFPLSRDAEHMMHYPRPLRSGCSNVVKAI